MIVECRRVEIPRRGECPDLSPPLSEYGVVLLFDKLCKFVENVDRHLPSADAIR